MTKQLDAIDKWTVMFFFASDNALAPVIVSQLRAIKDAGFQEDTNILVHFDPNEVGVPTRVFNINRKRKRKGESSASGDDESYFRDLVEDEIDLSKIEAEPETETAALKKSLNDHSDTVTVKDALTNFLGFCQENFAAEHYILFLVGHGMIVGSDAFLPDDHVFVRRAAATPSERNIIRQAAPSQGAQYKGKGAASLPDERPINALSLNQLGEILKGFTRKIKGEGELELLALHSCSMSSIEVAYQLKDTARYMMATEGVSFVGSWPYRRLLKKSFEIIGEARNNKVKVDVPELICELYRLSLHNGTDFLSAGYSSDLSLCRLRAEEVEKLTEPIQVLVKRLKEGLTDKDERVKDLILLAHWKAQSFWQENYTDLFDFCDCLSKSCDLKERRQKLLQEACEEVKTRLDALVVSDNFGSRYQYSHGLSIYFPWSKAIEVDGEGVGVLKRYAKYAFTTKLRKALTTELRKEKNSSWLSFLESYFKETQRKPRSVEDEIEKGGAQKGKAITQIRKSPAFKAAEEIFNPVGSLAKPSPEMGKPSPEVGGSCACPSIKNYPNEQQARKIQGRRIRNLKTFDISQRALEAFRAGPDSVSHAEHARLLALVRGSTYD